VDEEVFIPGGEDEAAAELEWVFAKAVLFVSGSLGALAGLEVVAAKKVKQGSVLEADGFISFAAFIDQQGEINLVLLAEVGCITGVAQADHGDAGAFLPERGLKFTQLRDVLSAEDSTVMAEKDQHSRRFGPERAQAHGIAFDIGQRYAGQPAAEGFSHAGHCDELPGGCQGISNQQFSPNLTTQNPTTPTNPKPNLGGRFFYATLSRWSDLQWAQSHNDLIIPVLLICYAFRTMREIHGAVAVITGAGSGIGRALAQELAKRGAQLALADVNAAGLEETRRLAGETASRTYVVDVSRAAEVEKFARQAQQDFGRVSLLVNNAGVALLGSFAEVSLEDMEWLVRINFWGVVYGCKFFLPLLQREKEAHIVNVSSVFGLIGPPGQTAYAASKFAVRGFSESLREELRAAGPVKVTTVHPAGVATPIAENARPGREAKAEAQAQAKERFKKVAVIRPEEAAREIVKGILGDKTRVLVGKDAYRIDRIQRMFPARAGALFADWLAKRTGTEQSPATAKAVK
jgi:NAD(P)-dependent dehydrogenase (short-subunit alcohol dehydrogenase family)